MKKFFNLKGTINNILFFGCFLNSVSNASTLHFKHLTMLMLCGPPREDSNFKV